MNKTSIYCFYCFYCFFSFFSHQILTCLQRVSMVYAYVVVLYYIWYRFIVERIGFVMQQIIVHGTQHVVQSQALSNGEMLYHVATYACDAPVHMVINMHYNGFCSSWYNVVYASIDGIDYKFFSRMRYTHFDDAMKDFYTVVNKYDMVLCGLYPHVLHKESGDQHA